MPCIEQRRFVSEKKGGRPPSLRRTLSYQRPMFIGEPIGEYVASMAASRLEQTKVLDRLGFQGFGGKTVADIGTRDGRSVSILRRLGASEVYGIEPKADQLAKAVESGILDIEHAVATRLEDLPDTLRGHLEGAGIFNFNVHYAQRDSFFRALGEALLPNGQVIMTVAERAVLLDTLPVMSTYFTVRAQPLWPDRRNAPHAFVAVGTRK